MHMAQWFVGIDWGPKAHQVCILDREGRIGDECQVEHTATALQGLVDALLERAQGDPAAVAIAITPTSSSRYSNHRAMSRVAFPPAPKPLSMISLKA